MSSDINIKRFINHATNTAGISTVSHQVQTTISFNNSFIRYSRDIYNIHVDMVYNLIDHSYAALFRKENEIYIPKETQFHTNTYDLLIQNIEIEMRSLLFSDFLGILLKSKIVSTIKQETINLFDIQKNI